MSDLTGKFTGLEDLMVSQQSETQTDLNDIRAKIAQMEAWLYAIQFAVEGGNRSILAALSAINPCNDCEEQTIAVPPVDTETAPIDTDKCKRVQAFLATMAQFFTVLDTASAFSLPFNLSLVTSAVNQVIAGLSSGDEIPVISFPEASMLAGDLVVYIANNFIEGGTLSAKFATLYSVLLDGMYHADSPYNTKEVYVELIGASGIDAPSITVLIDTAYNAVFEFYFNPLSNPNLEGFDGDICAPAPEGCYHIVSQSTPYGHTSSDWEESTPPLPYFGPGDGHYATPGGAIAGMQLLNISPGGIGMWIWRQDPGGGHDNHPVTDGYIFDDMTDLQSVELYSPDNVPWTADICPPEEEE